MRERGDKPEKWGEVDVEMGGCHFFITLQFRSITFTVCVCVWGGGGGGEGGIVRFPLYLSDLQSFELAMQDSHPSL